MMRLVRASLLAALLLLSAQLVAGCGEGNARRVPFAEWDLYEDPGGGFHFRYPDPPWDLIDTNEPGTVLLEIPDSGLLVGPFPAERLEVTAEPCGALLPCLNGGVADLEALLGEELILLTGPDDFFNFAGDAGLSFSFTTKFGIQGHAYYIQGPEGIVSVLLGGVNSLGLEEYELMAATAEPRPSSP